MKKQKKPKHKTGQKTRTKIKRAFLISVEKHFIITDDFKKGVSGKFHDFGNILIAGALIGLFIGSGESFLDLSGDFSNDSLFCFCSALVPVFIGAISHLLGVKIALPVRKEGE